MQLGLVVDLDRAPAAECLVETDVVEDLPVGVVGDGVAAMASERAW